MTDEFEDWAPESNDLDEPVYLEQLFEENLSRRRALLDPASAFPLGNNQRRLVVNFNQRLQYKNGNYFDGLPEPLETYYDKNFYGRVDRFQNVIVPKKDSNLLKQASYEKNIFVFNFVADALFKLKRNLKIAGDTGQIATNTSVFYILVATRGWFNYVPVYQGLFRMLPKFYDAYLYSLDKREFNKIITFQDYVGGLINYLKVGTYKLPISLTQYVLSNHTSPVISGITAETAITKYGDDLVNYMQYISDPNFDYYVRAARKFGFYVDRNAPWRLFADVFSPPMLEDLGTYGVTKENFFDTYYDRTYTLDVELMREELVTAYNHFAAASPKIIETVPGLSRRGAPGYSAATLGCSTSKLKQIGERQPIASFQATALGTRYWLAFYFHIRMIESGVTYKNSDFLIDEAAAVARAYGYQQGLIYVNNLFKPYLYDERIFDNWRLTKKKNFVRVGEAKDRTTSVVGISNINSY